MKRLVLFGILVAVGTVTTTVKALYQAPGADAPKAIQVDKLKGNLFILRSAGAGNTAAFVTAKGVVLVDTKLTGWGQPLLDKVKTLTDKPVTAIINTHTHFDHVGGNVEFAPTVEVITHENTKRYMEQANPVYGLQSGPQPNIFKENAGRGLPTRTFKDKLTVGTGEDQIELLHFGPAHTGGDAFVIFRTHRTMHVGDTMPSRDLPIMDKNNGGSGIAYAGTIAKASAAPNVETIINGHNATTTTPADLKLFSEFVADFVKFVQDAKKAGKTVDDVVAGWKVPEKYAGYAAPNLDRVRANAQVIWDETK